MLGKRIRNGFVGVLALLGAVALIYMVVGLVTDINQFDPTDGGFEYPYEGWTGTPIDYSRWYTTDEGMFYRGILIDQYANCETGLIEWGLLGIFRGTFREFSDRAKAVHQPQVACQQRGFDTSAWDQIAVPAA